jgi:hypothetical protein
VKLMCAKTSWSWIYHGVPISGLVQTRSALVGLVQ